MPLPAKRPPRGGRSRTAERTTRPPSSSKLTAVPGRSPVRSRTAFGITTWPLAPTRCDIPSQYDARPRRPSTVGDLLMRLRKAQETRVSAGQADSARPAAEARDPEVRAERPAQADGGGVLPTLWTPGGHRPDYSGGRSGVNLYPMPKCVWTYSHAGAAVRSLRRTLRTKTSTERSRCGMLPPQTR